MCWCWCLPCIIVLWPARLVLRTAVTTSFTRDTSTTACTQSTTWRPNDLLQSSCQAPQCRTCLTGCGRHHKRSVGLNSTSISCFTWYSRHKLLPTMCPSGPIDISCNAAITDWFILMLYVLLLVTLISFVVLLCQSSVLSALCRAVFNPLPPSSNYALCLCLSLCYHGNTEAHSYSLVNPLHRRLSSASHVAEVRERPRTL